MARKLRLKAVVRLVPSHVDWKEKGQVMLLDFYSTV